MDGQHIHQKSVSPPKALVDSSPLQSAMERNRESLKIKLMVRRSANQLVEQGILPPLKTSPAIHEQKKLLERAKTGDMLKAKIQQRPNRQELERRHILESHESHIDPSLADKYRMLEKAILVDQLNSKISHRPGPLELIEKNILHANEPIERIVKEGLVPFKASTDNLFVEDDSQSSEGDINSQADNALLKTTINIINNEQPITLSTNSIELVESKITTSPLNVINLNLPLHTSVIAPLVPKLTLQLPTVSNEHDTITLPCLVTESLVPVTRIEHNDIIIKSEKPPTEIIKEPKTHIDGNIKHHISSFLQNNQKFSSSGKDKLKKKCKIKPTSKIKAIKFHEYKGPPNAQKNSFSSSSMTPSTSTSMSSSSSMSEINNNNINKKIGETNYELIMQQQCLLEYLEGIYKNPNKGENDCHQDKQTPHEKVIDKYQEEARTEDVKKPFITIFPSKSPTSTNTTIDKDALITDANKLGKMKVSELKSYLKKLNLPVSGPKPLLIERLKPYLPFKPSDICRNYEKVDTIIKPMQESKDLLTMKLSSNSLDSLDTQFKDDDIVKEQQRQIEELQRKLLESQSELEQIRLSKVSESSDTCMSNKEQFFQIIPDSTVFVVGVSPINTTETPTISSIPMLVQEQIEDTENNNINNNSNSNTNNINLEQSLILPQSDPSKDKANTLYNNAIVQDDINDVLEILLKNEKWNGENEAYHHADKNGIDDPKILLDSNGSFSSSLDKEILGGPHITNELLTSSDVNDNLKNENLISFPMEVEENSNSSLSNIDALSYFKKDSHNDNLHCNVFDNNYCNNVMKNVDSNNYNNGIKNSLIGNFDNGMFDTFKTNIVNSSSNTSLLGEIEQKEVKYNDKYIFNGINNFDVFGNGAVESTTPMDFENIISYDIYTQHDPFFSINSFQNVSDRDNFINNHVNGTSMFCEDDTNMFEAGNDIKW
ncbi:myocardin [Chironomus tepperi]|uniref:myocardin n=1 Tax=Chironomus tepperi TaxID=113505 RepID=UPI00391F2AB5